MKRSPLIAVLLLAITMTATALHGQRRAPDLPPVFDDEIGTGVRLVEADFAAPALAVWSVLPSVLLDLGIEPQVDTTRTGVMGNNRIITPLVAGERTRNFVTCGNDVGPGLANMFRTRLNLVVQVAPEGESTHTFIRLVGTGRTVIGSGSDAIQCITTGRLEQRIIDGITAELTAYGVLKQSAGTASAP
ncbi:MAG TPA: hypothetical protein VF665_00765 [Longimicrobium sp.]|jgi:hypothetical protein|uniref:hypothetical protein n=1 Tax=Longimicrobium sp. TaxID=2029185 RepID=UPI002ED8F9D9